MEAILSEATEMVSPTASQAPRRIRGFWALMATQFQNAYSDNILRNLLLSMIVGMGMARETRETFVSLVTFLFSVPFLLFSMPGGWLADRFSKRRITIWTKWMEIGLDGRRDGWTGDAFAESVACRADAGGHAGCAFWPLEVWLAAGIAAGGAVVLGQWIYRAGHVSGYHSGHSDGRCDGREAASA